jgi:ParB-like chromosome segregation protein Spo0J
MAKLTQAQAQARDAEIRALVAEQDALADIATSEQNSAPEGALLAGHNVLVARVAEHGNLLAEIQRSLEILLKTQAQAPEIVAPTSEKKAPKAKAKAKAKASAPAPEIQAPTPKAQGTLVIAKSKAEAKRLRLGAGASNSARFVCSCGIFMFHDAKADKHVRKGHTVTKIGA